MRANVKLTGLIILFVAAIALAGAPVGGSSLFSRALASVGAASVATSAAATAWSGSIVLQNHGAEPANALVNFYSPAGVLVKAHSLITPIPPKGSVAIDMASISDLPSGFAGSAVVSSSQPVSAAFIGFDAINPDIDRTIYTGYAEGTTTVYVPAISNAYADQTSTLVVQNVESGPITISVRYYERFTGALTATVTDTIPGNASHYFDSSNLPGPQQLPAGWSGAALVQSSGGRIVAAVHQPYLSSGKAVSFEALSTVGTQAFLPSALFQYPPQMQTTFIAVQNTQASPVDVKITFFDRAGAAVGSVAGAIEGFRKQSWNPGSAGIGAGFIGSAVVQASGPVAAIVNIGSDTGLAMAYDGVPSGYTKVALPYVRWSPSNDPKGWRTYIAAMNVSQTPATITVRYYDTSGSLVRAETLNSIAPNTKGNNNPGLFLGENGTFVGTVEIESDRPIAALVNAITVDGSSSASYTGIPIP
ncbi:MAG: hypothetical protein HW403_260 [Dehalococcoidia bacterium]|nr:hypothetical protein [Dehalococcoidia bacterium]